MGMYSVFGKQIKNRLTSSGMTIRQLADEIGTTSQYMSKILHGSRSGEKYRSQIEAVLQLKEVRQMSVKNCSEMISLERLRGWCVEAKASRQFELSPVVRRAVALLDAYYESLFIGMEDISHVVSGVSFYYAYEASRYYGVMSYEETEAGDVEFMLLTSGELESLFMTAKEDSDELMERKEFMFDVQSDALKRGGLSDEQIRCEMAAWENKNYKAVWEAL